MPSNAVLKLLPPGVPVLSCQFSVLVLNCQLPVLSSQFLSLDASGDCSLFGTRAARGGADIDRKSTRLNSSHGSISYAVFCLKKKKNKKTTHEITVSCRHR